MNARTERAAAGALIGLVAAAAALGVGEIVAAFVRGRAAPVIAVGNRLVVLTPEPVRQWAISTFGTADKTVLLSGIYLVVALLAIAVGILALRSLPLGLLGVVAFGAAAVYCAVSAPAARAGDAVPTLLGTVAALVVMTALVRAAGPNPDVAASPGPALADRRRFLTGSLAAACLAAITGFGGRAVQRARFDAGPARAKISLPPPRAPVARPKSRTDLGKSGIPWVTPNADFYRVDTAFTVPQIDPQNWSLRVHGMVDREITLNYQQLLARGLVERWITLCCVSNEVGGYLIGNARWRGALLADILREAGLHRNADQLLLTSIDGMSLGAPSAVVMDGRAALVAVGMNGVPLPIKHGFPARIVVPGLYGYVSACKWVVDIEATTFAARPAFWVSQGWAQQGDIKLESRIDTPSSGAHVGVGAPVPIAGVAWDQHVGVSEVAVQINDGAWQSARLAAVPSTDTWRQWVLGWTPPEPGSYTIRVRARDARGRPQTARVAPPYPSGATGLHTVVVRAG